jgi:hypothetical protein
MGPLRDSNRRACRLTVEPSWLLQRTNSLSLRLIELKTRPCPGAAPGDWPLRWSADGRVLFVGHVKGRSTEIYRLELLTGRRTFLKAIGPRDTAGMLGPPDLRLSADGKSYAYSFYRSLSYLYLVDGLK